MIRSQEALERLGSQAGVWTQRWSAQAPSVENLACAELVVGVDEAGRGALIGPVACGAVLLDPARSIVGLGDSKKLTEKRRAQLFTQITDQALASCLVLIDAKVIDRINILQATLLGMKIAVEGVQHELQENPALRHIEPSLVRIDGNRAPELSLPSVTEVKGDARFEEVSAASIVAKVGRDCFMEYLSGQVADYDLKKHKGYPTKAHMDELCAYGPTAYHRKSFAPVAKALCELVGSP